MAYTLKALLSKTNVSCKGGADGTVTIKASGGIAPFTYSLKNGAFLSTRKFTGLKVGWYSEIVRDAKGCLPAIATIRVNEANMICHPIVNNNKPYNEVEARTDYKFGLNSDRTK